MGLFSCVKVHPANLPGFCCNYENWQTKDVIEPCLDTLELTKDGNLLHIVRSGAEWVRDKDRLLGGYYKWTSEEKVPLTYTGIMNMYTFSPNGRWVEFDVYFIDGKVSKIQRILAE